MRSGPFFPSILQSQIRRMRQGGFTVQPGQAPLAARDRPAWNLLFNAQRQRMINSVASPPAASLPPPRRPRFFSWFGLAALVSAVWALGTILIFLARSGESAGPPRNRPIKAQVAPDIVSSETCRSCHPGNYASWHASFHRTMTQVAVEPNFATRMEGLQLSLAGRDFRVERQGGHYQVRTKPAAAPASAYGPPQ
jgi:hypothetical protein